MFQSDLKIRTQNDKVTVVCALAVPHPKSATLNPSIACPSTKISPAPTEYADEEVSNKEFVNPAGAVVEPAFCC
jgi:hypothetical protein